jgi:CRISPR/Cas system-associated exonuclease Cas4 (RecB family)
MTGLNRIIRASEIGTFLFCQRAWWYALRGFPSKSHRELAGGKQLHEQHGKQILVTGCLKIIAYILIGLSIALITAYLVYTWID